MRSRQKAMRAGQKGALTKEARKHGAYALELIRRLQSPVTATWLPAYVEGKLGTVAYRARLAFQAAQRRLDLDAKG